MVCSFYQIYFAILDKLVRNFDIRNINRNYVEIELEFYLRKYSKIND